jgi:hydrogenase/urease accessory protein HupE
VRPTLVVAALVLLWSIASARAHRLDEFLQATTIAVAKDQVTVQIRLTPGVAVVRTVLAELDFNGDGVVPAAKQRAYAERVLHDLSLTVDGRRLALRLSALTFPSVAEMKEGFGEIQLRFEADVPPGGPDRRLLFENHYQSGIAAYLVNCLSPNDPAIHVIAQNRNFEQSFYQLDYTQAKVLPSAQRAVASASVPRKTIQPNRQSLFAAYFYHGIHHILTGYDHLLFVSALVLAATTLWDLVKVVSTFTVAHTITLTLAALNLVHLPGRVVEPLIAASIVFVAIQNVFWPRRARGWSRLGAAFFFGLFHGLGFAGGLLDSLRELPGATLLLAILAFSIGVEAGHQMVVLPLFASLKAARRTQSSAVARTHLSMAFQRIGSAGILTAGAYYLCVALAGHS